MKSRLTLDNRRGKSSRVLGGLVVIVALMVAFPRTIAPLSSVRKAVQWVPQTNAPLTLPALPEVRAITAFLKLHKVGEENLSRVAQSIAASARKHKLNPRLLASIIVVESRGNPFAISGAKSVGIMQIHLPTWGETADREDVNLLKIEDNIDFGARILKDYIQRFGVSGGVKRYNGFIPGEPVWEESAERYLGKVQSVYESNQPVATQASLFQ
jgi:soluble lytic murein transglycosylase-like protein